MTGRHTRTGHARFWAALTALLTLVLVGGADGAAAADRMPAHTAAARPASDPNDPVQATLERAEEAEATDNPNAVLVDVILRDKAGNVPEGTYRVFVSVFPYLPDEGVDATPSKPEPCRQPHFSTNPEIDEGVFRCTYLVGFPDTWTFDVTVNKLTTPSQMVKVTQAQATFPVSDAVVLKGLAPGLQYAVKGSPFDVLALQIHFAAATIWLFMVTVMAFLAVPGLRRMLSTLTLYALEVRRYFLNRVMWGTFGVVLVTGTFLLGTQTAYGAPWSSSTWDNMTTLPYATTYFAALFLKILVFVVMAAASVVLMTESARRAQMVDGFDGFDTSDDEFWRTLEFHDAMRDTGKPVAERRVDVGGGVATAVAAVKPRQRILTLGVSPRTLWWCAVAVAGGMGVIGVCVTVLKYTHELIEMLVAAKTIAEAE